MNNEDKLIIEFNEIDHLIKCLVNLLYFYSENSEDCRHMHTLAKILDKNFETAFNNYNAIITSR